MENTLTSSITVLSNLFESSKRNVYSLLFILPFLLITSCQKQERVAQTAQPVPASSTIPARPPGYPPPVLNQPYPATWVVVLINRKEGWIEINHDEIKGLMPAMQMEFWVNDKSLFDNARAGDRVDFTIVETEKGEYLTELKRAGH